MAETEADAITKRLLDTKNINIIWELFTAAFLVNLVRHSGLTG